MTAHPTASFVITILLAVSCMGGALGQTLSGPDAVRRELNVIERDLRAIDRAPSGRAATELRRHEELRRLETLSPRQSGRQARVNDGKIGRLQRQIATDPAPKPGPVSPGLPEQRTKIITPAIPETDLDPDAVFGTD